MRRKHLVTPGGSHLQFDLFGPQSFVHFYRQENSPHSNVSPHLNFVVLFYGIVSSEKKLVLHTVAKLLIMLSQFVVIKLWICYVQW